MVTAAEERILTEAPREGKLAQAYLISAGSETEAERAAEAFLRRIFCEDKSGCGSCGGCIKFDAGNHVDLYLLEDENGIKKDQLIDLDEFLSKKSYEGGYRCVYIKGAHRMNPVVQNKLLKSIEEPPENVIFVLATNEPEQLLSTTCSRCVPIRIRAKSRAEIKEMLTGKDSEERIKELSERITPAGLSIMTEELLNAYQKKKTCQGLNAKLLAQTVLFKLVEVRNKCLK